MKLNIFRNLSNEASKFDVNSFIKELTERLEMMEKELTVDRFEGKFAVCEDRKTGKNYNIEISQLAENIKEGSIIKLENGKYIKCENREQEISDRIKNKMEDLWN